MTHERLWPIDNQRKLISGAVQVIKASVELSSLIPTDEIRGLKSFIARDEKSGNSFMIIDIPQLCHPSCPSENGVIIIHPVIPSESGNITDLSRIIELPRNPKNVTESTVKNLRRIGPKGLRSIASQLGNAEVL